MDTFKETRLSQDRQTEYQIEYSVRPKANEYRVRRGTYGTWTRWFQIDNVRKHLAKLGFTGAPATLLDDLYMEAHFGRGVIKVNQDMALDFAKNSTVSDIGRHVYSRLKQVSADVFTLPASVITNQHVFEYIRRVIQNNL